MSLDGVVDIEERYNKYKRKWRKNTRDRQTSWWNAIGSCEIS